MSIRFNIQAGREAGLVASLSRIQKLINEAQSYAWKNQISEYQGLYK